MNKQEAIAVLYQFKRYGVRSDTITQALEMSIRALDNEREHGEWIDHDKDCSWYRYQCSNCLALFRRDMYVKGYPYCPRCGAFMKDYDVNWKDEPDG